MESQDHDTPRLVSRHFNFEDEVCHANRPRYLVAKLFKPFIGCETSSLRALNVGALCLICPLTYGILRMLRTRKETAGAHKAIQERTATDDPTVALDANTALNITLFPPLFFFSALFYTDVMSTLMVLLSYSVLLKKTSPRGTVLDILNAIVVGVFALLFRQTNIFWVAVFPAALSVIDALTATSPPLVSSKATATGDVLQKIWDEAVVHDCSVQDAGFQGTTDILLVEIC